MNDNQNTADEGTEPRTFKWRYHGNGFIQVILRDGLRLHIWDPALPVAPNHNAMIHTHRFDMKSYILKGRLRHTTFDFLPSSKNISDMAEWVIQAEEGCKSANFVLRGYGILRDRHIYELTCGSSYTFARGEYHLSENVADGPTVTIMNKISIDELLYPMVLVKPHIPKEGITNAYNELDPAVDELINNILKRELGAALESEVGLAVLSELGYLS